MQIENTMSDGELRKFGITMAIFVSGVFGLFLPWLFEHQIPRWPWSVSAVFAIWAIGMPASLSVVYKCWMYLGGKLGWLNTRIILGIAYLALFIPIGLGMRLFGYDPLNKNKKLKSKKLKQNTSEENDGSDSYRVTNPDTDNASIAKSMENPY